MTVPNAVTPSDRKWPAITASWASAITGLTSAGVALASNATNTTWMIIGAALAGMCTLSGLLILMVTGRRTASFRLIALATAGAVLGATALTGLIGQWPFTRHTQDSSQLHLTLDPPQGVKAGTGFRLSGTPSGDLPPSTVLWPSVQPDSDTSGFYAQGRNCGTHQHKTGSSPATSSSSASQATGTSF